VRKKEIQIWNLPSFPSLSTFHCCPFLSRVRSPNLTIEVLGIVVRASDRRFLVRSGLKITVPGIALLQFSDNYALWPRIGPATYRYGISQNKMWRYGLEPANCRKCRPGIPYHFQPWFILTLTTNPDLPLPPAISSRAHLYPASPDIVRGKRVIAKAW